MTFTSKKLGDEGEDKARKFLEAKGLVFLGKNIRLFCGEIDLLMQDQNVLVIVEVKTKSSDVFGLAKDMITLKKKKKLLQLGKALMQKFPSKTVRIDVIAIDEKKIEHIISAVEE